jgi:hypothetical protein
MRSYIRKWAAFMKRISFRADESLIRKARLVAVSLRARLHAAFPKWLKEFSQTSHTREFHKLMTKLRHVEAGRRFTRDEMNER